MSYITSIDFFSDCMTEPMSFSRASDVFVDFLDGVTFIKVTWILDDDDSYTIMRKLEEIKTLRSRLSRGSIMVTKFNDRGEVEYTCSWN